jgi:muconate cycloisomerase
MRIVELTVFQVRIPLRKPFRHASHTRTSTDNVVIRCALEDGTIGYGEGVPREYVTGETIDSALELLARSELPAQLEPPRDFPAAVALAERLRLAPIPGDDRQCQGNAARCAIELAVLDAYGRHFRQPLARVTELLAPDLYKPTPWVRYSGAITTGKRFKLGLLAWVMRFYRFRQVKVKVGIEGHDDVYRLKVLRPRLGRKIDVRVDANEAWAPAQVVQRIEELKPFGVTAFEQPVPHADVACLREARRRTAAAVMLDESLCSAVDAQRALDEGTCDLFNLRLSKCGGFIPTLRLARFARAHGLGYQLGCQVGETALLSAAGRHFASTVGELRYIEGSYDRHLVREALGTRDISFRWGGWAPALTAPGLGIDVDPKALARVTVRQQSLFDLSVRAG